MSWYRWRGDDLCLDLRIAPRSSRNAIGEICNDRLKLKLTSPPVDGKANDSLTRLLAKLFGVPRAQVSITHGERGRDKTVCISAPAQFPAEITQLIERGQN